MRKRAAEVVLNNSPVFAVCKKVAASIRQEQKKARCATTQEQERAGESEVCSYMRFIQTRNSAADIG